MDTELELALEPRDEILTRARIDLLQLAADVEDWCRQPLDPDNPYYGAYFESMRTMPEAWRRGAFGDAAIDAEGAEEAKLQASSIPEMEVALDAKQARIESLERALSQAHRAIDGRMFAKRRSEDQSKRAQAPRPDREA